MPSCSDRLIDHEIVVGFEPVEVVGDVERVHRLDAGAIGVAFEHRHHRRDPLPQRGLGAVALQLVILDEVDAGRGEIAHEVGEVGRGEPDAGLDDRADHGAVGAGHQSSGAGDAELRAGVALGERRRQVEVDELDRRQLLDLEQVPRDGGQQVRQRGPEVLQGEADAQPSASPRGRVSHRPGQRGCAGQRDLLERFDLGREPRAQIVGLALHPHEGAGRLLAREHLGGMLQRQGGLDDVGRDDVRRGHDAHHTTGSHTDISPGPRLLHA